jgi:hypothetical protein
MSLDKPEDPRRIPRCGWDNFGRKRQLIATFPTARVMVQADGHGPGNDFADR